MKHLKLFESFSEVENICKKYNIENYTVNPDGSIDVEGNVDLSSEKLDKIPLNFNIVTGFFNCYNNQLTSLKGAPKEVGGSFDCDNNKLTSLEGAPREVGESFYCINNQLTSLEGCPREVGGDFYCNNNRLPKLIRDNLDEIKSILKYQDEYSIWNKDGSLNEFRFKELLKDI